MNPAIAMKLNVASKGTLGTIERAAVNTERDYAELLDEIHGLLNDYAPVWYTEELCKRTEGILTTLRQR
jgi:hypothetical protein